MSTTFWHGADCLRIEREMVEVIPNRFVRGLTAAYLNDEPISEAEAERLLAKWQGEADAKGKK